MFSQDILMREMMQFVRHILASVMALLTQGNYIKAQQIIASTSEKILKLPLEDLLKLTDEEIRQKLQREEWPIEKIHVTAELLFALGKTKMADGDLAAAKSSFSRSQLLFLDLCKHGEVYFMEWESQLSALETYLNELA